MEFLDHIEILDQAVGFSNVCVTASPLDFFNSMVVIYHNCQNISFIITLDQQPFTFETNPEVETTYIDLHKCNNISICIDAPQLLSIQIIGYNSISTPLEPSKNAELISFKD